MSKKIIGIVGGGQLGRMLTQAAHELGFVVRVLDPTPMSPAGLIADQQIIGKFTDAGDVTNFGQNVDFLTFEIESANNEALAGLAHERPHAVQPAPETLALICDKLVQKQALDAIGIPAAPFKKINNEHELLDLLREWGAPVVLKARYGAYDGRGNALITSLDDIEGAWAKLGGRPVYAEKFIPFEKELAVVIARGSGGETRAYPVVETIHQNHICHLVIAPALIPKEASARAEELAQKTLSILKGRGVFAIEMFLTKDGRVLVNEIAPRVHNSGHVTIEACETSQFQQHIRAITGMPLGSPALKVQVGVMINILGDRSGLANPSGISEAEQLGAHVHVYGKKETRPERKMGHITITADNIEEALERTKLARSRVTI